MGLLQLGLTLLAALPLAAGMLLAVKGAWAGRDINGLLILRPPEFWQGALWAALPALALVSVLVYLVLRWLLALPLLVADPALSPFAALRESARLTRGRHAAHVGALLRWVLLTLAPLALVAWLLRLGVGFVLTEVGGGAQAAVAATALLLVLGALAIAALSWVALAAFAALLEGLRRLALGLPPAAGVAAVGTGAPRRRWPLVLAVLLGIGALGSLAGYLLLKDLALQEDVEITAHRAGAIRAPENTLAALRLAIEDGADWAEIDVQRTHDDALVVLHDTDLARVGGGAKRVREATLAEIRALDVGAALGRREFAGERVPTLEELISLAADRIRLNIELKPAGPDDVAPLTDLVLAAVRSAGLVGRCVFCSQSYEAMRRAQEAEPGLAVGWIAGASLGDVTRLEVDFLMLNAAHVTRSLVDRAHAQGIAVHAWTVNDLDLVLPLVDRGVDNLITDDPAGVRARLAEVRAMSTPERVLLRARHALAR
jgi:glycerophosphoryl diester phosphodiesterase